MMIGNSTPAIVTGGSSGLGAATVAALSAMGAPVVIFDRIAPPSLQPGVWHIAADITDPASVANGLQEARARQGQERILVNCAGGGDAARTVRRDRRSGAVTGHPIEMFDATIRLNLIGTFNCLVQSACGMAAAEPLSCGARGAIINTASIAAEDGQAGQVAYAAAKAGIAGMTLPLARDLMHEGIRVNTILPGIFATPPMLAMGDESIAALSDAVPFPQRLGDPAEFADLVVAMIANAYLNGAQIRLDGALRMAPR